MKPFLDVHFGPSDHRSVKLHTDGTARWFWRDALECVNYWHQTADGRVEWDASTWGRGKLSIKDMQQVTLAATEALLDYKQKLDNIVAT